MLDAVDVATPTHESAGVVGETLDRLAAVEADCDVAVNRLVVVDDESTDDTRAVVRERADRHGWPLRLVTMASTLPEARELLVALAETEWLLFLDDDVRLGERYLDRLAAAAAPGVGGVQGRKANRTEPPSEWVRRRARRGGTHATLVRAPAAKGVDFPGDLHVLEDEYLRRHVESRGYLWVFNHQATFAHANQDRHPIGWQEGYLAGKYGLKPFHEVALNVPFAAVDGRSPVPHAKRAAGWLAGRAVGGDTSTPGESVTADDHVEDERDDADDRTVEDDEAEVEAA